MSFLSYLKTKGYRLTKVRAYTVTALTESPKPLSVGDLGRIFEQKQFPVNKTTLYREIMFLKDKGLVQEVEFGDGKKRYELTPGKHHHHVICVRCKTVEDVPLQEDFIAQEKRIARETRFKIINHSLEFFGLCANCQ